MVGHAQKLKKRGEKAEKCDFPGQNGQYDKNVWNKSCSAQNFTPDYVIKISPLVHHQRAVGVNAFEVKYNIPLGKSVLKINTKFVFMVFRLVNM